MNPQITGRWLVALQFALVATVAVPAARPFLVGMAGAALAGVLTLKAGLEERWMAAKHPGYNDYCKNSKRFVPGVF